MQAPQHSSYDVVIVGGAMYGSSVAWFLVDNPDFDGRILVIERDPTYAFASTSHTNSCMRQAVQRKDQCAYFAIRCGLCEKLPRLHGR